MGQKAPTTKALRYYFLSKRPAFTHLKLRASSTTLSTYREPQVRTPKLIAPHFRPTPLLFFQSAPVDSHPSDNKMTVEHN